jgi:glycosyltransferase involved in cell wall biosynthesis
MKVTFVSSVYPHPKRGVWLGMERLVESLSEALVRNGVDLSVITSYRLGGEKDFEVLPSGIKLFRVRSLLDFKPFGFLGLNTANFSASTFGKYFRLLRDSDTIHVFSCSLVPFGPMKNSLPPVLCYFPHFDLPKSLTDLLYVPYIDFLLYLLCRSSDFITAGVPPNSPQLCEFLKFFHVPEEKVRFLYEAVDSQKFNPKIDASEVLEKFEGSRIILYAGSIIPRKGLIYLIQAIPHVVKEVPEAKFVFVGGKSKPALNLKKLAQQLGVEKHVFFEGFVSDVDLPKYYKAADVLSCPSLREGYPLPCLEAMACGTPIVGTNLGTISEVVGDSGILVGERDSVQLAEGIIAILKDPSLKRRLGERAARRVKENFTWEKVAQRAIEIYKEAMELRKRG